MASQLQGSVSTMNDSVLLIGKFKGEKKKQHNR